MRAYHHLTDDLPHKHASMRMKAGTAYAFGGGGGSSGPSATQKENDRLNQQLLRKQLAAKQEKVDPIAVPKAQKFAPAPTETSADTDQIARDFRRRSAMRQGIQKSRLAGETGGFNTSTVLAALGTTTPTIGQFGRALQAANSQG